MTDETKPTIPRHKPRTKAVIFPGLISLFIETNTVRFEVTMELSEYERAMDDLRRVVRRERKKI